MIQSRGNQPLNPIVLLLAMSCLGWAQVPEGTIQSMEMLVGKQVIIGRMTVLCAPGTIRPAPDFLSYASKQAKVVSMKPFQMTSLPKSTMNRLPPATRERLEDAQKGAFLQLTFEDGTTLDTCGPYTPSGWQNYLELAPGQSLDPEPSSRQNPTVAAPAADAAHSPLRAQECPVSVVKVTSTSGGFRHALVDGMTKSDLDKAVERAKQGGHDPHYLDVRVQNVSKKPVHAIEAFAVYSDKMGDESARESFVFGNDKPVHPGGTLASYVVDTTERWTTGLGDVTVYVSRVRFEDDTFWKDDGTRSCALKTRMKY